VELADTSSDIIMVVHYLNLPRRKIALYCTGKWKSFVVNQLYIKNRMLFDKSQFPPVLIEILIDSLNSWAYGWTALEYLISSGDFLNNI